MAHIIDRRKSLERLLSGCLAILEQVGHRVPVFGNWYHRTYYQSMLERELDKAQVIPGSRILHVGCGSLPSTAMFLARKGYLVTAIDRDAGAVARAREVICREGLEEAVQVELGTGQEMDCGDFDAVWLSLTVAPKDQVLEQCLRSLREEGIVVLRNAAGVLRFIYTEANGARQLGRCLGHVVHERGKASQVLQKPQDTRADEAAGTCSLCDLSPGQTGVIVRQGEHPLLSPLGFRVGKSVRIHCRQCLGGPLVADLEGKRVALDTVLASQIGVLPSFGD